MKISYINGYIKCLNKHGHVSANAFINRDFIKLFILSGLRELEKNIELLKENEIGGILYTENQDFLKSFKSAIQNNIWKEIDFYSDVFNSDITLLIYQQSFNEYKFIYEMSSKLVLRII